MFDRRCARFRVEDCRAMLDMLKRHEGTRRRAGKHVAYRCPAGFLTIGWGHNLDAHPLPDISLAPDIALDDAQAHALLQSDTARTAAALDIRLPWWRGLGAARSAVLLDMAFNLGPAGLLDFRRMLSAVRRGDFARAAEEMLDSRWAHQVGVRAVELAEQMRQGRWQLLRGASGSSGSTSSGSSAFSVGEGGDGTRPCGLPCALSGAGEVCGSCPVCACGAGAESGWGGAA